MWNDRKPLSDAELLEIINNLDASEDEYEDFSDTDSIADPEYVPEADDDDEQNQLSESAANLENVEVGDADQFNNEVVETQHDEQGNIQSSTSTGITRKLPNRIIWRKRHLVLDNNAVLFRGKSNLSNKLLDLETPYACFKYFFTDTFLEKIVEQSNLYSVQKNPSKPLNISVQEISKFLGICLYMSVSTLPRTRCYWRNDIGIPNIRNTMTINRFEAIKANLHFNNNETMLDRSEEKFDSLHKFRPLIEELCQRFASVPLEHKLSIDEQICATKARHHLKQYNPMKPNKWGFKLFMLCGIDGFCYNFEIYQGSNNYFTKLKEGEPDLGSSANIVVRLARVIPKNVNHQLYCDNYYTSVSLFSHMTNQGIYMLGTVRRNRIANNKLTNEKEFKKMPRGTSEEFMTNVDGVDLSLVAWKDNKVVHMLSSCHGELPLSKVKRFDKKLKEKVEINRPNVIQEYNKHMGGVDLLDSFIGRYKIPLRSKKWYLRIFFHLLDVTTINAWLLYKRIRKDRAESSATRPLNLWEFRLEIAECLCLMGTNNLKKKEDQVLK